MATEHGVFHHKQTSKEKRINSVEPNHPDLENDATVRLVQETNQLGRVDELQRLVATVELGH